jgi:hypothetical protein
VLRALIASLIVTRLAASAVAGPQDQRSSSHDPKGALVANGNSPWLDQSPARVLAGPTPHNDRDRRLTAGLTLAGVYAGFIGWAYLAWYRNHPEKDDRQSFGEIWDCAVHPSIAGCDGWFGVRTYAGGGDKLGHAWATMVLARSGTALLDAGGWKRTHAALFSSVLAEGLFFAVEIKDYYYYEFSPGDFTMNTLGALAAIALDLSPRLDELVDFRVQYWPSRQYRNNLLDSDSPCAKRTPGQPSCSRWNVAEDYSGETYLLALHLGALGPLRGWRYGAWSEFVDVSLGFQSRNYKPPPTLLMMELPEVTRTQDLFLGLSVNAQGIVDHFMAKRSRLRTSAHGVLEVLTPPLTVPMVGGDRSTTRPGSGGA